MKKKWLWDMGLWSPLPTGLACSAALPCPGGIWRGPAGWLCPSVGLGKWTAQAPALVLASGTLLHAYSHKLFLGISFVPGIMPGIRAIAWIKAGTVPVCTKSVV